jgi:hypothetical protein
MAKPCRASPRKVARLAPLVRARRCCGKVSTRSAREKTRRLSACGFRKDSKKCRQSPTLAPWDYHRPSGLHYRVRNGNGCFPRRICHRQAISYAPGRICQGPPGQQPHGGIDDRRRECHYDISHLLKAFCRTTGIGGHVRSASRIPRGGLRVGHKNGQKRSHMTTSVCTPIQNIVGRFVVEAGCDRACHSPGHTPRRRVRDRLGRVPLAAWLPAPPPTQARTGGQAARGTRVARRTCHTPLGGRARFLDPGPAGGHNVELGS